ncbi:MAG TPA: sulfatase-like hydrolase/transferase [Vicinamibacterales bacterium]
MKRSVLALSLAGICALLSSGCSRQRHNVLVITIDTLRADHLGCYGLQLARTPVIDDLARNGIRCSDAIAAAPITMPAHTSVFTGLFPPAHGVRDNGAYALGSDATTLAERLHSAGYTTHAFVSALVLNRRYNLNQGFETYDDDLWAEDEPKLFMIRERRAPKTADRFLAWFDGWKAKRDKPFFTWVHFFDPHQPYHPEQQDLLVSPSPYDAEIAGVDRQIGRMVDALRKAGVLDDTLLVVTADHGESLGEHGEQTHAIFVYDATVHVPLILRAPWLFQPSTYTQPVRSVDIMPTILDALGLPEQKRIDGTSLLAAFRGKAAAPSLPQYSESLLSEVGFGMAPLFSIRDGGYKYIRAPKPELYDLRKDPRELDNIFATDRRTAARLDGELTKLMDGSRSHAVKAAANPMTKESEEALQALGYLAPKGERSGMGGMDPKDGLPIHNKLEDARHLAQLNKWPQAEKLLLEILAVTPKNVSALNILGLMNVKSGNAEEALKYYNQSLAIDPNQFRVFGVLGTVEMLTGDYDAARTELTKALAINPYFAEAMANLGFLEEMQGHHDVAEAWYRKGIASDPTFPRVYRRLGDLYYDKQDYAKALDNYEKTIKILPTDARAVLQAGNCARRLGRVAQAQSLFQRAEQLRPDGWVPTYNRACLLATTGHPDQSLQTLQTLAARHPLPVELVEHDPDLTTVRALPNYAALRKNMRADVDMNSADDDAE